MRAAAVLLAGGVVALRPAAPRLRANPAAIAPEPSASAASAASAAGDAREVTGKTPGAPVASAAVGRVIDGSPVPGVVVGSEPGRGERSDAQGGLDLGAVPARGALRLWALAPGVGPPGVTLWPPAPVWPAVRDGELLLEHALLRPTTAYRLELAWADGQRQEIRFTTEPLPEALARGPEIGRVDPAAAVWVRFGADVDRASVEASFHMEPPANGAFEWVSDREVRFRPAKILPYGVLHRVSVGGQARGGGELHPAVWSFRTLIPPPARVVPGEGSPAVFTFDDGTHDMPQAWALLDLLKEHGVKAILFPTGRWARSHPDYIARALREGHRLCNHSETHARLPRLNDAQMEREITRGAGHGTCDLLRPPSMDLSKRVERMAATLGYKIYLWDVDSRDWESLPAEDIVNRVLARMKPSAVLLFHMHGAHTIEALPRLFRVLREAGYRLTYEGAEGAPKVDEAAPGEVDAAPP